MVNTGTYNSFVSQFREMSNKSGQISYLSKDPFNSDDPY